MEKHLHIQKLLKCINLEEKAESLKYTFNENTSVKALKSEGFIIHPIKVTRKYFGYADYPEFSFAIQFPNDTSNFRDGISIELFIEGEEPIRGMLLSLVGKKGEVRLYAPSFPDWLEESGVGVKLSPDHRTNEVLRDSVSKLQDNEKLYEVFRNFHKDEVWDNLLSHSNDVEVDFQNEELNTSQKNAVRAIIDNIDLTIIHGPPGTGKTTTLIEAVQQLVKLGEKIIISAPTNTAVDNVAKGLIEQNVKVLRVGNLTKVDDRIFPFTAEGALQNSKQLKEIKKLKIRAEELRKMANQYKRNFGKEERVQRDLLYKEVKLIRKQIKEERNHFEYQLYKEANVVLGTPIGLNDFISKEHKFHTLIIDEAGQCLEPQAWVLFAHADKFVLAGDHLQLPPLVFSQEAIDLGYDKSILELGFQKTKNIYFLDTQYRMRSTIATFSSDYFYKGELKTGDNLKGNSNNILFYDTAGAGYEEAQGEGGKSLLNEGEIDFTIKLIEHHKVNLEDLAFISPYSSQVEKAKNSLPNGIKVSTIDSFQGQEKHTVIISLVRSNNEGVIGFLKDYRRMNVAMTRAKEQLIIIGDSSTIGSDPFYEKLLNYIESIESYKSVWELL